MTIQIYFSQESPHKMIISIALPALKILAVFYTSFLTTGQGLSPALKVLLKYIFLQAISKMQITFKNKAGDAVGVM
jgi:hypothetical protein